MQFGTCELLWSWLLLYESGFIYEGPMVLHSNITSTRKIETNLVFHERRKNFEVDVHFIREKTKKEKVSN